MSAFRFILSFSFVELFFFAKILQVEPVRVGAVSYLNTKPFVLGLTRSPQPPIIQLSADYPAAIATQLQEKKIDIGLIPVAAMSRIPDARLVTDFCIGAEGPVASVAIFSEVPLEKVTTLILDYQSNTSVSLARILLKEYWQLNPTLEAAGIDFMQKIKGTTAAVVIGDRALDIYYQYPYRYDLAEAWMAHTGLPFVFAAWVANRHLPDDFIASFNNALEWGVDHWQDLLPNLPPLSYDPVTYFSRNISYELTSQKKQGMELFLKKLLSLTSW